MTISIRQQEICETLRFEWNSSMVIYPCLDIYVETKNLKKTVDNNIHSEKSVLKRRTFIIDE
ncbi:hypothetical protein Smp_162570 [Schistosoma mansoni]|uniref:hypothetical protein n=1 Tax=Schistosoma mansoni TaxID=6183 RepID=UPI0001A62871|nr:hypothetical protein Smp_162570 [Schistosoma mansoni]|eukprot:XP_018650908.1 hypothetical protein Smp_162570 [Schistosoma mansoni]